MNFNELFTVKTQTEIAKGIAERVKQRRKENKLTQEELSRNRLMCFNVFAHNRDDHSKNFSYIYAEEKDEWKLSPAYDLTYSNSIGGEHATCVDGNGNPTKHDILAVAKAAEIDEKKAIQIMNYVEAVVREELREYL